MEAHPGFEQIKSFPQGGEIQDGNTGNHQDLPSDRGVGHLYRLQGRLLPHSYTGTVQEIPKISCPGSNIPIQGPALWSVHSTLGIHSSSKGGETDGSIQGYKDPPVPRRLVGESHIPPGLSPAYQVISPDLSGPRLAGKSREIRTGTQTGLRLCRLSVRPPVRSGPTHIRTLAEPPAESTGTVIPTDLPGPGVHVPNRVANSHRKTSSSGTSPHEANSVAFKKQLESTRISGENYSRSLHPHLQWWLEDVNVLTGQPLHPLKHALQIFTDASKEGWDAHLDEHTARGTWSLPESKQHINYLELKAVFLALKEFQKLCFSNIVLIATDNTTVVSYINKEGGMRSGTLCALLWRILTWCTKNQVTLKARHIPDRLNVVADKLSRLGQIIQTEWSLLPEVFQTICCRWHQPQIDLFATRFNNKLPQFVSPVPDSMAIAVDSLSLPWEDLDAYAFPPIALLGKVVEKLQDSPCKSIILIAPGWPNMPWFWDLVSMSSQIPLSLPFLPKLLTQPFNQTQKPVTPQSSCLAPRATTIKEQGFSEAVATRIEAPQRQSTRSVYEAKWTIFTKWCVTNQVDFSAPPVKSVADFLMYLFQDRKLQPSTIDGYRSAIADKLGNSSTNISKDENLTRLLDSFHRDRPKGRRGIPSWNLSLVLHQLTKAPFEPLKEASLKHLTFKTVFLLALGSGKRRSEIHAWQKKNIRHQTDWSKVSLFPSPSFLSKNQLAKESPESVAPVVIPALAPTLDRSLKSDRSLCPVRALRYYLDRTSDLRQNKELVFISFKKGFDKDISPATISSWIKQTVILCYELSDQESHTLHQVKAHDVRAFAASKAFQSGVSLEQILSACHWKSHNTFTQFYLKDVAWADSELYHLGPVVAAQQIHQQAST